MASIQQDTIAAAGADAKGTILMEISAADQKEEKAATEITGELPRATITVINCPPPTHHRAFPPRHTTVLSALFAHIETHFSRGDGGRGSPECIETTLAAAFKIHEQLRTAAAAGDDTAMSVDQCFKFMQEHSSKSGVDQDGNSGAEEDMARIEQTMKFMTNEHDVMQAMGRVTVECDVSAEKVVVQGLRHHFGPSLRDIWALDHPTHAVFCALLGGHAYWMLIGACDPML